MNWYIKVLKQYADFSGRSRRTEIWMFTLFSVLITIVLTIIDALIGTGSIVGDSGGGGAGFAVSLGLLSGLYTLAVLVPSLAVGARRLHDTGRSGWWQLIALIPFIGGIVLLVFFVLDGNRGPNQHGADPKALAGSY